MTNETAVPDQCVVTTAIGVGLIPIVAPRRSQHTAHSLHPLLDVAAARTADAH